MLTRDNFFNKYKLDNIIGDLHYEKENLSLKTQSLLTSSFIDGSLEIELKKNNKKLVLIAEIIDSINQINLLANYDLNNDIWKINSKIINYLFKINNFNTNISGNIDFYGKSLDLVNTEIKLNLNDPYNYYNIENIVGKINYNNGELFSIGDLIIKDENFNIITKDFYMNKDSLQFNSSINFSNYSVPINLSSINDPIIVNGITKLSFNKKDDIFFINGYSNLNNIIHKYNSIDSIDFLFNGEYFNENISYNINSKIQKLKTNFINIDSINFNIKKDNNSYFIDKISLLTNRIDSLIFHNIHFNSNLITLDSLHGNIAGPNINSSFLKIKKDSSRYFINNLLLNINNGHLSINGSYLNNNNYDFLLDIKDVDVKDFKQILINEQRFNGKTNATINFNNNDNQYTVRSNFLVNNGKFDDILFDQFSGNLSLRNNKLLLSEINFISKFGEFYINGWLTSKNLLNSSNILNSNDSLYIKYSFYNFNLNKFNRYLPFSNKVGGILETEGLISGNIDNIEIYMDTKIDSPVFDNFLGENLSGTLIYKDAQIFLNSFNFINSNEKYTLISSPRH